MFIRVGTALVVVALMAWTGFSSLYSSMLTHFGYPWGWIASWIVVAFVLGAAGRLIIIFDVAALIGGVLTRGAVNQYPWAGGFIPTSDPRVHATWEPLVASLLLIGGLAICLYFLTWHAVGAALLAGGAHALGWGWHRIHRMPWQIWAAIAAAGFVYYLPVIAPTQSEIDQLAQFIVLIGIFIFCGKKLGIFGRRKH